MLIPLLIGGSFLVEMIFFVSVWFILLTQAVSFYREEKILPVPWAPFHHIAVHFLAIVAYGMVLFNCSIQFVFLRSLACRTHGSLAGSFLPSMGSNCRRMWPFDSRLYVYQKDRPNVLRAYLHLFGSFQSFVDFRRGAFFPLVSCYLESCGLSVFLAALLQGIRTLVKFFIPFLPPIL